MFLYHPLPYPKSFKKKGKKKHVWGCLRFKISPSDTVTNPNKVNSTGHLIRLVHFHSHSPAAETSPGTSIIFVQRSLACRAWKGNPQPATQILRLVGRWGEALGDWPFGPEVFPIFPWPILCSPEVLTMKSSARPHLPQFPKKALSPRSRPNQSSLIHSTSAAPFQAFQSSRWS